jgi:hypothetical protein
VARLTLRCGGGGLPRARGATGSPKASAPAGGRLGGTGGTDAGGGKGRLIFLYSLTYMIASQYSHRHFGLVAGSIADISVPLSSLETLSVHETGVCPYYCAGPPLYAAGQRFFMRVGGDVSAFLPRDFALSVQRAIDEVGNEVPP